MKKFLLPLILGASLGFGVPQAYEYVQVPDVKVVVSTAESQYKTPRKTTLPLQTESGFVFCSGVVFTKGYYLTAKHCISDVLEEDVKTLKVGKYKVTKLVYQATDTDLAILKYESDGKETVAELAKTKPAIDTELIAIGYPMNEYTVDQILTQGRVNGYNANIGDKGIMNISAPLAPGNSGGPVFAKEGGKWKIVGIGIAGIQGFPQLCFAVDLPTIIATIERGL